MPAVVAIVVTYRPDLDALSRSLDVIGAQVDDVVIADNDPSSAVADLHASRRRAREHRIDMGGNRGIAAAQNAGIAWARDSNADFVVLFDQDSEPAADMIARLLAAADELASAGHAIGAIGPNAHALRAEQPPLLVRALWLDRPQGSERIAPVDFLIASGALIPMSTLDAVGGMVEELFIDYVDAEWGRRAAARGFRSYTVRDATMKHALGDARGAIPMHSPLRHYYHFRNAVWMYRQPDLELGWKLLDGYRLLLKLGFYAAFARPRRAHVAMMLRGIRDGVRGRLGEYKAPLP